MDPLNRRDMINSSPVLKVDDRRTTKYRNTTILRHVQICNDVQTRFIRTCSGGEEDQRSGTKLYRMH